MRITLRFSLDVFILILSALFCARAALATVVIEQTFPDLVHRAEVIVVGTVTKITERWDAAHQTPFTDVTFSNLTTLKGDPGKSTLTLTFFGGHLPDGTTLTIAGMPRFVTGEKNVIFSMGNYKDVCPLVGLWQGRLRVQLDAQSGEEIVRDNFSTPIIGLEHGQFLKSAPGSPTQPPLPLAILINLIQQELGNSYGQP